VIDASANMQDGLALGATDKLITYLKADALHFAARQAVTRSLVSARRTCLTAMAAMTC
jgi:hypothetical protein